MIYYDPIGGYFEFELNLKKEYHQKALKLNTGRNALEYILIAKDYKKIHLPFYSCDALLEPIKKHGLEVSYYHINSDFEPIIQNIELSNNEAFVYINYFGICDNIVKKLAKKINNLIIDNSQAFYSKALPKIDTFYSPRKFFGVPDGAYLYVSSLIDKKLEYDISYNRCLHLLGRIDKSPEEFYESFKCTEDLLKNQHIKQMSKLTRRILKSIDYSNVRKIRRNNFNYIHKHLKNFNKIKIKLNNYSVPMIYPFLFDKGKLLKENLIKNKIYCATYWPNVKDMINKNTWEYFLYENLVAIPIDQRYGTKEMKKILSIIWKYI